MINGKRVVAQTHIPLQQGRTFTLITDSISPVLSFKPVGIPWSNTHLPNIPLVLSASKENIWGAILGKTPPSDLSPKALFQLSALIKEMTLDSIARISPEYLKRFIEKSGLGWEAKLRKALGGKKRRAEVKHLSESDLKGLASKLIRSEGKQPTIDKLISVIKNVQLLNQTDPYQGKNLFLPIPIQYPGGECAVCRLLIQIPGKELPATGRTKSPLTSTHISLQGEFSELGPVYIVLCITGKTVTGKFFLNNSNAQLMVEENLPLLADRLRESGYVPAGMACFLSEDDVIEKSLVNELYHSNDGMFNLVI